MSETMSFKESEKINVTKHTEKKGRFTYLSWPFAVSEFRKACPDGRWDVRRGSGGPFTKTEHGIFVEVTVTPDVNQSEVYFSQIHPVLDNKNSPIADPNAYQINTSIQRCLVKAIALATGIGLHIYAGEDLPPSEDNPAAEAKIAAKAAVGAESFRKGEAAVENKVPHTGKVASWIASGAKEILAGGSAAVYWSENKVQIKKDCGDDGAKEVYKMVIK